MAEYGYVDRETFERMARNLRAQEVKPERTRQEPPKLGAPLFIGYLGVLDETLSDGGSATVSIWAGDSHPLTDSTINVTAYDWFLPAGATITAGTKVVLASFAGRLYVINASCEGY